MAHDLPARVHAIIFCVCVCVCDRCRCLDGLLSEESIAEVVWL
jgi:hypothetical protein